MSFVDWLVALHLIAAFALVSGLIWLTALMVAGRGAQRPADVVAYLRLVRATTPLVGAGALLVLVLGIWLAIDESAYQPWDGWIVAAIALWVVAVGCGQRAGVRYAQVAPLAREQAARGEATASDDLTAALRSSEALILHVVALACVALILIDMIYKPGA